MKKATIFLLAFFVCAAPAMAESGLYTGEVVAAREVSVLAPSDGTVESYAVQLGERIEAGALIATYETEKVYATGDGTVAAVWAKEGEEIDGALVEVEPIGKYTVYCTVDGGYAAADNYFVHAGETIYIKCTEDGTHRGTGTVTSVDGAEYMVTTTGGEFYVGETVYLYRDADFTYSEKIGVGTLIYSDNTVYEADGAVIRLHVQAGDRVERGQLLYEILGCAQTEVTATVSGIVASIGGTAQTGTDASDATDSSLSTADTAQTGADASDAADSSLSAADAAATETSQTNTDVAQTSDIQTTSASDNATSESSASDNSISEGDALAVLYPDDAIVVEMSVSEDDLGRIAVGQSVDVVFADDSDTTYAGVILRVSNIAEDDGTYRAQVAVERQNLSIGMTCDVITD
jgi:multidrug efflux pump subunit AcrA (membrane-fusion protein)